MKITYTLTENEIIKILSKYLEVKDNDIHIFCREVQDGPYPNDIKTCAEAKIEKETLVEELEFVTR